MALLPRVPKFGVGTMETSYTLNTALKTTEDRGTWPATLVPGIATDTARSVNKTTATINDIAPWPFANVGYNAKQVSKAVNHVLPTKPATQADEYAFDNGLRGETLTLDVLANDGDNNVLNNVSPLVGPELVVRNIDDTGFTLGTLSISEDKQSVEFVLGNNFFGDQQTEFITQTFTYKVTNLTGISKTETVTVTVSQNIKHVDQGDGNFGEFYGSDEAETIVGEDWVDFIYGGGGNDTLYGNGSNDRLYGQEGDDLIFGGDGEDWLSGSGGDDTLYGDAEGDVLEGGAGSDELHGGEGDDTLIGDFDNTSSGGDDILYGDGGHDILFGGAGNDALLGGDGADVFYFVDGSDLDAIFDFNGVEGDLLAFNSGFAFTGLANLPDFIALASSGGDLAVLDDGDSFSGISVYDDVREVNGATYAGLTITNDVDILFLVSVTQVAASDVLY